MVHCISVGFRFRSAIVSCFVLVPPHCHIYVAVLCLDSKLVAHIVRNKQQTFSLIFNPVDSQFFVCSPVDS